MFIREFCNIFLKNSKFIVATSIQLFNVSVISYCFKMNVSKSICILTFAVYAHGYA